MQRLWATLFFSIGILLCSSASADSVDELVQQRDALERELEVFEQIIHLGRILVPTYEGPKYYSVNEFAAFLPQLMSEHNFGEDQIVEFLSTVITYHQNVVQEIKTIKMPGLRSDIQNLNDRISAMTNDSPDRQHGNSSNQRNLNIFSSDYGKTNSAPSHPVEDGGFFQELPTTQNGIVAEIIRKHECKYRSGGNPGTRSNHACRVEYSITNTTDKVINFSSGFTETEHEWNGGFKRGKVGYKYSLQPTKTMHLSSDCIVPHEASHGNWEAWGTGSHPGNSNKDQFSWRIGAKCP